MEDAAPSLGATVGGARVGSLSDLTCFSFHPRKSITTGEGGIITTDDETVLFFGDEVVSEGAVGVRLDGVEVLPMVSQGATPLGPELTITAGQGHVIGELAGKPALEKLRETIEELPPEDLRLVQGGLLVGIVVWVLVGRALRPNCGSASTR